MSTAWLSFDWPLRATGRLATTTEATGLQLNFWVWIHLFVQVVRVCKVRPRGASKEASKNKCQHYLGFHPDPRFPFDRLNGASLDYVKQHLESFGGKVVGST